MPINYPAVVAEAFQLLTDAPTHFTAKIDYALSPYRAQFRLIIEAGGQRSSAMLSLHLEKKRVDWHRTTPWLFGRQHRGAGALGVVVLSSPFLLIGAPYIIARRKLYDWSERRHGMTRHAIALLEALRGELTDDENDLLVEVFRNEYAHGLKMSRQIDLVEAKAVLSDAVLHAHASHISGGGWYEECTWVDGDGEIVGEARIEWLKDRDNSHFLVRVLGSRFRGGKAEILLGCFASCNVSHDDEVSNQE